MKTCTKCNISKSISNYYINNKGRYNSYCKECQRKRSMEWHYNNKEKSNNKSKEYMRLRLSNDTYREEVNSKRRVSYREKYSQIYCERSKKYRENNKEYCKAYLSDYYKKNPETFQKHRALRSKRTIDRTPAWANLDMIKELYIKARHMSNITGILHHVDHIVPLNGKNISGLHIESNLRVIPASENLSKKNKLIPELVEALIKGERK